MTIFGDLYKFKLWGICKNFNQFTRLSSASGPSDDIIKKGGHHTIIMCMYLRKIKVCLAKYVFNRFNAGTAPDFKQTHFYTKIYFKMQCAILLMSLRHKPRFSLCQMAPIFLVTKLDLALKQVKVKPILFDKMITLC